MKQRQLDRTLGRDTHVRDSIQNIHQRQHHETFQMVIGEIDTTDPEPLFNQNLVSVKLARGGEIPHIAYPGAFIEPISGNVHGLYEGPISGQMVIVGFENGNLSAPFVINRYPYQGRGDTFNEQAYIKPLTTAGYYAEDVILGHYSGSFLCFNTGIPPGDGLPGSAKLKTVSDLEIESGTDINISNLLGNSIDIDTVGIKFDDLNGNTIEMKPSTITLTALGNVEINGNTDWAVAYTDLKTAFDQFKTDFNNFVTLTFNTHAHQYLPGPGSLTSTSTALPVGTGSTADMSSAKVDTVRLP